MNEPCVGFFALAKSKPDVELTISKSIFQLPCAHILHQNSKTERNGSNRDNYLNEWCPFYVITSTLLAALSTISQNKFSDLATIHFFGSSMLIS